MERGPALQPRLRAIADLVPEGSRLVDVGTDHGYIPVHLLLAGRIPSAIASDIGAEPLDHARRTAAQFGAENIDFRLSDGLAGVAPDEADAVVIAGMGGDTIAQILAAAPWTGEGKLLLLQPMSKAEMLRAWLPENGYAVRAERLVADKGVLYPILTVTGGDMAPATPAQAYGGFLLGRDELWGAYLAERILRLRKAAMGLQRARDEALTQRRESFLQIIAQLEQWKGEWKMPTVHEIEAAIFALAPRDLAMDFDNVGHLVGDCERAVHKVLVALDITPGVVREAAESGCDLIVSHHPVIFPGRSNLRTVRSDDPTGRLVMDLIRRDIAAICMHTNLDTTAGGVNDALAAALELRDVYFPDGADVERVGLLAREMSREDFLAHVKERLRPNGIRYAGGGDRPIRKVAVGGGSCGDFFAAAAALGCDAFVTADVKYNQFLSARELGLCLVDAGHFPTENVVCPVLADYLAERFPALTIVKSSSHREVINYYV